MNNSKEIFYQEEDVRNKISGCILRDGPTTFYIVRHSLGNEYKNIENKNRFRIFEQSYNILGRVF